MARKRINHIPGARDKKLETFDPNDLEVVGRINKNKLGGNSREDKTVIVMEDYDGKKYVADGRHAVEKAKRNGEMVQGIRVDGETPIGKQSAVERVLGMLLGGSGENKG